MPDRLSAHDVSFLYLEQPSAAMHVGTVMVFDGGAPFEEERIRRLVSNRIAGVPRYRRRVRSVPGGLANPVWVDDEHYDLGHHVRRVVLSPPGTHDQLADLVAAFHEVPLDRTRPLWEVVVVGGLEGGRSALVTKVHQALVDGVRTVDLAQLLLDEEPTPDLTRGDDDTVEPPWRPEPEPGSFDLLVEAVAETVRRPGQVLGAVRSGLGDVRSTATRAARSVGGLARIAGTAAAAPSGGPLARPASEHRRFAMVRTDLAAYRGIRRRLNARSADAEPVTVNDVVLATIAGALRAWLLTRGEPVGPGSGVRTLVPMSVRPEGQARAPGNGAGSGHAGGHGGTSRVTSLLVDLPTGERNPLMRVFQVAYQTSPHRDTGRGISAPALAGIAGFAPPTLHSLGARLAGGISRRVVHLVVTNVPGPQQPLYLDGARMVATYPVVPVASGQVLGIGVTSYDGGVYTGLYADREAVTGLDVLGQCLVEAVDELREAVR